jgi:hypothetical protein
VLLLMLLVIGPTVGLVQHISMTRHRRLWLVQHPATSYSVWQEETWILSGRKVGGRTFAIFCGATLVGSVEPNRLSTGIRSS